LYAALDGTYGGRYLAQASFAASNFGDPGRRRATPPGCVRRCRDRGSSPRRGRERTARSGAPPLAPGPARTGSAAVRKHGLGLAIARRIAHQHHGDLTCDDVQSGASFTLWLPAD